MVFIMKNPIEIIIDKTRDLESLLFVLNVVLSAVVIISVLIRYEYHEYFVSILVAVNLANTFLIKGVLSKSEQQENTLKESEKKYRLLVERMNDGLGVVDENGVTNYVNNSIF